MKPKRHIRFINNHNDGYPASKPGVLVVYRVRYVGPDSICQYHVIFRLSTGRSVTFNCVDAKSYRQWLTYYSSSFPIVEIYHGTVRQNTSVTTFIRSTLYTNEFYKWWHGRAYVIRGSIMWGREFEGSFSEVVTKCLDYGLVGKVVVHVGDHEFLVPATIEDLTAFRLRESELFEGFL